MNSDASYALGDAPGAPRRLAAALEERLDGQRRLDVARFGMWLFLVAEAMLFAGLIGAFVVGRALLPQWPPPAVTQALALPIANSLVLAASALCLEWAARALAAGRPQALVRRLLGTLGLGAVFLGVQVVEYQRSWARGFTLVSEAAGNYFYFLAGCHGLHVAGGLVVLAWVAVRAARGRLHLARRAPLDLCRMYWHFVVLAWGVLFVLLYLG